MSTITTSAINKSGKTVAPKAVARRKPAERRAATRSVDASKANSTAAATSAPGEERAVAGAGHESEPHPALEGGETGRESRTRQARLLTPPPTLHTIPDRPRQTRQSTTPALPAARSSDQKEGAVDQVSGQKRKRGAIDNGTNEPRGSRSDANSGVQPAPSRSRARNQPQRTDVTPSIEVADQAAPQPQPRNRRKAPMNETTGATNITNPTRQSGDTTTTKLKRKYTRKTPRLNMEDTNENEDADEVDPEQQTIDPMTTRMTDLIREPAIGQVSEREKRMREINWAEVARKRREQPAPGNGDESGEQRGDNNERGAARPQRTVQLRMVNGQMVVDETSQLLDRHAQALMNYENAIVDENYDLTRRVNRMSWLNDNRRDPADRVPIYQMNTSSWTDEETDRFYEALRMFGTDFHIISKMFAPKTRRQIKLKFVREERLDPARVNAALAGIVPMDLNHFVEASGIERDEFKDPAGINEELEAQRQINEAEIEKRREEASEAQKQKDIMYEQREREREERDREKAAQKASRDENRRRKRRGIVGSGTF